MRKTILLFFLALVLGGSLFFSQKTLAATTLSIENAPSSLDFDQEFDLKVNLFCTSCSDSYLRGVFYPSGSSYFGFTKNNNGEWVNSPASGCLNYFKVGETEVIGGTWSATLKYKPDKDSSYYNGPGEYLFKVGRYTSSCSSVSVWSNEVTIALKGSTPTPSSSTTSISSISQSSPSPSPSVYSFSSSSSTSVNTSSKAASVAALAKLPKLLPTSSPLKSNSSQEVLGSETNMLPIYAIIGGLALLIIALGILFREKIRSSLPF